MVVKGGRVVLNPGGETLYKVVLEHDGDQESEHPVGSVREGEALIRERAAMAVRLDQLREWNPLA